MDTKVYTVIAYKPDSDSYCMGCHMASYSSDMQWFSSDDTKEVVKFLAGLMAFNAHHLDTDEDGFEFTYLLNGIETAIDDIVNAAQQEAKELVKIMEEKQAAEKVARQKREQADREKQERQQYERLKEKFDSQS